MIVLDTHVLIWLIREPEKIPIKALNLIKKGQKNNDIYISSISMWEIAMLENKNRLRLNVSIETWLQKVEDLPFLNFISIDNNIAIKSVLLGEKFHGDPADRIIVATALKLGATLITADKKILSYKGVRTTW